MKRILLMIAGITLMCVSSNAQYRFPRVDVSVADILYYPINATHDSKPPKIKIIYSRPLKNGREVFGGLQKFGQVWRVGANEATEIRLYVPVKLGGKKIKAGTYALYAIPEKDNWTIILNRNIDKWGIKLDGSTTEDPAKDVVRLSVPVKNLTNVQESLAMTFTERPDGANLVIGWDKTAVEVPFIFDKN
jgi:hypothetical protein